MSKEILRCTLPMPPRGKASVRVYQRSDGSIGRNMPTGRYESQLAFFLSSAWKGRPPHEGPLALQVLAIAARPKKLMRRRDPDGLIFRPHKPDLDNVHKSVKDAMKKAGIYRDDCQVVLYRDSASLYTERNGLPRVEVVLWEIAHAWAT